MDHGSQAKFSIANVTINVLDDKIRFIFPNNENNLFIIEKPVFPNKNITTLRAKATYTTDPTRINYKLTLLNNFQETNLFAIDIKSGEITITKILRKEDARTYTLNLEAFDPFDSSKTPAQSTLRIIIEQSAIDQNINSINGNRPVLNEGKSRGVTSESIILTVCLFTVLLVMIILTIITLIILCHSRNQQNEGQSSNFNKKASSM